MECVIGIFNGIVIKDCFWLMEPADTPVVVCWQYILVVARWVSCLQDWARCV